MILKVQTSKTICPHLSFSDKHVQKHAKTCKHHTSPPPSWAVALFILNPGAPAVASGWPAPWLLLGGGYCWPQNIGQTNFWANQLLHSVRCFDLDFQSAFQVLEFVLYEPAVFHLHVPFSSIHPWFQLSLKPVEILNFHGSTCNKHHWNVLEILMSWSNDRVRTQCKSAEILRGKPQINLVASVDDLLRTSSIRSIQLWNLNQYVCALCHCGPPTSAKRKKEWNSYKDNKKIRLRTAHADHAESANWNPWVLFRYDPPQVMSPHWQCTHSSSSPSSSAFSAAFLAASAAAFASNAFIKVL